MFKITSKKANHPRDTQSRRIADKASYLQHVADTNANCFVPHAVAWPPVHVPAGAASCPMIFVCRSMCSHLLVSSMI